MEETGALPTEPVAYRNTERGREMRKAYAEKYRDKAKAISKQWYKDNKERAKETQYRWKYGISTEDVRAMKAAQNGVCAICLNPETATRRGVVRELCVDHDHDSGNVRGLLCKACNIAIGEMRDDPDRLLAAASYLNYHRAKASN